MLSKAERERRYAMLSVDQRWTLARRHKRTQLVHAVSMFVLFIVVSAIWIPTASFVLGQIGTLPMYPSSALDALPRWLKLVLFFAIMFGPQLFGLVYCARASQKACAMKEVGRTKCDECEYSLMGLPAVKGRVRCPECGREMDLCAFGTWPEDLVDAGADDAAWMEPQSTQRPED